MIPKMAQCIKVVWVLSLFAVKGCSSLGLQEFSSDTDILDTSGLDGEGRFLFYPFFVGGGGGMNITQIAALAALAAAAILPLLGLAALGLLLWAVLSQQSKDTYETTYGGGHGGYGGHSSYSSQYRALDTAKSDWEQLSILDWIAVAEETYSKYEPSSLECQKKVICELYQNAEAFGPPAQTFMKYFSYLQYVDVLNIPDSIKTLADELLDAAERGKSMKKTCAEVFTDCLFSIKEILIKYGHGNFNFDKDNKV
ncbi:UNVERIFIED_CONTAM: hypothetical protein RMT77_009676 [Armadillidium vulgare]